MMMQAMQIALCGSGCSSWCRNSSSELLQVSSHSSMACMAFHILASRSLECGIYVDCI